VYAPPQVKPLRYPYAHPGKPLYLLHQNLRIEDDSVSNEALHAIMEDAGRHLVKDDLLALVIERVAGIGPTLEARHDFISCCQRIDDFSLPLVSPLKP